MIKEITVILREVEGHRLTVPMISGSSARTVTVRTEVLPPCKMPEGMVAIWPSSCDRLAPSTSKLQ